jgi:hypothetical protein
MRVLQISSEATPFAKTGGLPMSPVRFQNHSGAGAVTARSLYQPIVRFLKKICQSKKRT